MRRKAGSDENQMSEVDEVQRTINARAVAGVIIEKLKKYYRLLLACLTVYLILASLFAIFVQPRYLAVAIVGPPQTSLSQTILESGIPGGGLAGIASKLAGAAGVGALASQGTPFDEYTQLLTSNRLAKELAENTNILPIVFYDAYDQDRKTWRSRDDLFHRCIDLLKYAFNYPVKSAPNQDDLMIFLSKNMIVDTSLESQFVTVSLKFKDPHQAQTLLNTILLTADKIIRNDTRADVSARLVYLTSTLPQVTQTDVQDALISILSVQEQQMMAINADQHFAFNVVDPAYADPRPSWPNLVIVASIAILFSFATWTVLVFYLRADHWLLLQSRPHAASVGNVPIKDINF